MIGAVSPCRALVAGVGRPGMRDLDFGRWMVEYLQTLRWPDGVVVEELSLAAPLVLHRLQELRPAKLVLVAAVPRDVDPPGTVRRRRPDVGFSDPAQLHRTLEASITEMIDLDHTMALVRHWGELPADTVVIEVEPAETSLGPGFSEEVASCLDAILNLVREELAGVVQGAGTGLAFDIESLLMDGQVAEPDIPVAEPVTAREPGRALAELVDYAADHEQARQQSRRAPALVGGLPSAIPGVELAGRVRPWGVFADCGGDWFDVVPLDSGALGIVVGDLDGRGIELAANMSDLRAAVRAYAVLDGDSPARLLCHLDRLAGATGLGSQARLVFLSFHPATGELRFSNAGGCPVLILSARPHRCRFLDTARSAPLGAVDGDGRPEETLHLPPGSTLLVFSDGLVQSPTTSRGEGLERLRQAAIHGPDELDELCDHLLGVCATGIRRDDDICVVGVRRLDGAGSRPPSQ